MRHIFVIWMAVVRYYKAQRLMTDRDNLPEVLTLIKDLGDHLPAYLRVRIYLLRGFVNSGLYNLEAALKDLETAYRDAPTINRFYSKTDVLYMQSYAADLAMVVSNALHRQPPSVETHYERIDLNDVARELIRCFPLMQHPKWKEFEEGT